MKGGAFGGRGEWKFVVALVVVLGLGWTQGEGENKKIIFNLTPLLIIYASATGWGLLG